MCRQPSLMLTCICGNVKRFSSLYFLHARDMLSIPGGQDASRSLLENYSALRWKKHTFECWTTTEYDISFHTFLSCCTKEQPALPCPQFTLSQGQTQIQHHAAPRHHDYNLHPHATQKAPCLTLARIITKWNTTVHIHYSSYENRHTVCKVAYEQSHFT